MESSCDALPSDADGPTLHRKRALIVEDEPEMRRLLRGVLQSQGYAPLEAGSFAEAWAALALEPTSCMRADLIVTDVRLPGGNGLDLVAKIRAVDRGVPIVVITAFGDEETHATAKRLHAVMLDKPFDLNELRAAVCGLTVAEIATSR